MSQVGYINKHDVSHVVRLNDRLIRFNVKTNLMEMYKYLDDNRIYTETENMEYKEFKSLFWEGPNPL